MENWTIVQPNFLRRCLKRFSGWRSLLSFSEPLYLAAQIPFKSINWRAAIRSFQDSRAVSQILLRASVVKKSLIEGWTNKRLRFGALVVLLALPAFRLHLLFDVNVRSDEWYFQNYAFFFHNVKAFLSGTFVLIGFFIALPTKWKFKWWILPFVFFCVTEIYDRYFYDDYLDFQQVTPSWRVWGVFALCVPAVLFSIDYLLYRKYHLKDGNTARIIGMVKAPNIPAEVKMNIMEELVKESESFNARV